MLCNICDDVMILCILFNTQVDVPIRIHNGDTAIVTFTGVGYDKRVMGETMQLTADQLETSGVPSKGRFTPIESEKDNRANKTKIKE